MKEGKKRRLARSPASEIVAALAETFLVRFFTPDRTWECGLQGLLSQVKDLNQTGDIGKRVTVLFRLRSAP